MKPITYIGYYDIEDNSTECRRIVRSATTKMDYIASKIEDLGYVLNIVSMSDTLEKKRVPGHIFLRKNGGKTILFPSIGFGNAFIRRLSKMQKLMQLKKYLFGLTSENIVIAYHSPAYASLLAKARRKVGFRLVLEVEEIYADVSNSRRQLKEETEAFSHADAFICCTSKLVKPIGVNKRPYVICSGIYEMAERSTNNLFDRKRTHIVYAGTLDPRKGSSAAAATGAFLDENYHIHILGSGSEKEIELISAAVQKANKNGRGCIVSFEGYKTGSEFDSFIQSCNIGLSPQNPESTFNETSFPSKVFMYLSHGLKVVSVDLPVFEENQLRNALVLSPSNRPEDLAKAIRECSSVESETPIHMMKDLDAKFKKELDEMLQLLASSN